MDATGARLKILITDSCALADERMRPFGGYADSESGVEFAQAFSPAFDSLFLQPSGFVDINSSTPFEVAVGDSLDGGYFTFSLYGYLESNSQRRLTWYDVLAHLRKAVASEFEKRQPTGVPRGRNYRQTTQSPICEWNLQGGGGANSGTDGLRIAGIHSGSSAQNLWSIYGRVEPKVGDRLIAINGERLRHVSRFNELMASLPSRALITVTIFRQENRRMLDLCGLLDRGSPRRLGTYVE
jgi:hypothetical protein